MKHTLRGRVRKPLLRTYTHRLQHHLPAATRARHSARSASAASRPRRARWSFAACSSAGAYDELGGRPRERPGTFARLARTSRRGDPQAFRDGPARRRQSCFRSLRVLRVHVLDSDRWKDGWLIHLPNRRALRSATVRAGARTRSRAWAARTFRLCADRSAGAGARLGPEIYFMKYEVKYNKFRV